METRITLKLKYYMQGNNCNFQSTYSNKDIVVHIQAELLKIGSEANVTIVVKVYIGNGEMP